MPEKTEFKEIKLETLDKSRRGKNIGNVKKIFYTLVLLIIAAGAGIGGYRVMAGPVVAARFTVSKMNCPACITTVKEAAGRIPGVTGADVSLAAQEVSVFFKQNQIHPDEIGRAISRTGYPAKIDGIFNPKNTDKQNPVVAIVNNSPVFKNDMDQSSGLETFTGKSRNTAEAFFNSAGKKILLSAADNQNVVVQPSEIQLEIEKFCKKKSISPEAFEQIAEKSYGSMTKLSQAVAQKIAIKKMLLEPGPEPNQDPGERKRHILARTGMIFKQADVKIHDPVMKEKLHSSAGYTDWQTFWPQMIVKKTELMAMIDGIAKSSFQAESE